MHIFLFVAALLSSFPTLVNAEKRCREMGCENGLTLTMPPDHKWQPGAYRFELKLDGKALVCEGRLPLKACGEISISCNAPGVMIGELGCALEPGQQGFGDVMISTLPASVSLKIKRNGKEIADIKGEPVYTVAQPNGRGCAPVCVQSNLPVKF